MKERCKKHLDLDRRSCWTIDIHTTITSQKFVVFDENVELYLQLQSTFVGLYFYEKNSKNYRHYNKYNERSHHTIVSIYFDISSI